MRQNFLIRAENPENPLESTEIHLDFFDMLKLIRILLVQRRDTVLGRKFLILVKDSNVHAVRYLTEIGVKDAKTKI